MKDYYSRETLFFKFVNQGHHPSHLPLSFSLTHSLISLPSLLIIYNLSTYVLPPPFTTPLCRLSTMQIAHLGLPSFLHWLAFHTLSTQILPPPLFANFPPRLVSPPSFPPYSCTSTKVLLPFLSLARSLILHRLS